MNNVKGVFTCCRGLCVNGCLLFHGSFSPPATRWGHFKAEGWRWLNIQVSVSVLCPF